MSGYPGAEIERRGLNVRHASFIQKPFTPEAMVTAVNQALSQRPSSPRAT